MTSFGADALPADCRLAVLGPGPPFRGGISAHTSCLAGHLRESGRAAAAISFRRLYPSPFFPGRSQRLPGAPPPWCRELLDPVSPLSWVRAAAVLRSSPAPVLLQWWHPALAPAYLAATVGLPRRRLVALCHNVFPHEAFPFAAASSARVLGACGRIVCHSHAQADLVRRLLGPSRRAEVAVVPLPALIPPSQFSSLSAPGELRELGAGRRLFVVVGHLRSYKAVSFVMEAWSKAGPSAEGRLVVVGESYLHGKERREVLERAKNDSTILFVDRYVDDSELAWILVSAEALVAVHAEASQSGLVALARALGLPSIVSDAGGLAEQASSGALPGDFDVVRRGDGPALSQVFARRLAGPRALPARARNADAARLAADYSRDWEAVVEAIGVGLRP